jgi:hypothetical protein
MYSMLNMYNKNIISIHILCLHYLYILYILYNTDILVIHILYAIHTMFSNK